MFSLKKNEYKFDNIFLVQIDSNFISVLRQTRTLMSYEGIESLCSSIKEEGQKTPGDIYALKKPEAILYLQKMNELWNTEYKISSFQEVYISEKRDYYFLFLVAGHRRLKACEKLQKKYLTNIHFDKNFEEAIKWQLSENLHEELPALDQIISATSLWVMKKKENPKLTLKSFAEKSVHKSVGWLSNALRFVRLPIKVQDLIKKTEVSKGVTYSILLEFAKLYDFSVAKQKPLAEDLIISLINHCLTHKYNLQKVKEFCEIKKLEIAGQQELFELVIEEVNSNSLTALRRHKTLHMLQAETYLKSGGVIARQITETCKSKAENVLQLALDLNSVLPSE